MRFFIEKEVQIISLRSFESESMHSISVLPNLPIFFQALCMYIWSFFYFYLHDVLCMYYYLYSRLLSSLEALSLSCDCEKGFRVKLEWLSSCVLSPTYQAKCGLGDPSSDEQVRLRPWPSRRVWFWGRPLISGGLGGPANISKHISDANLQLKWLDFTWNHSTT